MADQPETRGRVVEGTSPADEGPTPNGPGAPAPRLVHRDGLAYVEGCDVPVWRLEMSRRTGSAPSALLKAFPALTPEGLERAFAYARQHGEETDALIRELGPSDVPSRDEGEDDEGQIQADLDEIFEEYGEVFRRLAR